MVMMIRFVEHAGQHEISVRDRSDRERVRRKRAMRFNIGRDRATLSSMLTPGGMDSQLTRDPILPAFARLRPPAFGRMQYVTNLKGVRVGFMSVVYQHRSIAGLDAMNISNSQLLRRFCS